MNATTFAEHLNFAVIPACAGMTTVVVGGIVDATAGVAA